MSRPNEYFHSNEYNYSRFIDLSERKGCFDGKEIKKSCTFPVPIACSERKYNDEPKSYKRVLSDVVKVENSLDYGIITRSASRMSDHTNVVNHRVKTSLQQTTSVTGDGSTNLGTTSGVKGQSKQIVNVNKNNSRSNLTRTTAKCEQVKSLNPPQKRTCVKALLEDERRQERASLGHSVTRMQKTRHKSNIPPPSKINISSEEISRRWQSIKQQEKMRRKSEAEAVTYMYELNGRRLSTQSLSANNSHCCGPRPVSRTLSESDMPSSRFGCC